LSNVYIPNVLLLGNGLNQANGGPSWREFLENIAVDEYKGKVGNLTSPEPLKAVLVTNDNVNTALKEEKRKLMQTQLNKDYVAFIESILETGFDDILTTNYTYELESVALLPRVANDKNIRDLRSGTERKERYCIHTCNEVSLANGDYKNRIWHIHGEASCYGGMVLGHYYYGNLLSEIRDYQKSRRGDYLKAQKTGKQVLYNSWIDSFVMGDIYVLGFGFGLNELDLWWLLNRKAREKAKTGKVYFYEPSSDKEHEKVKLLKALKCGNEEYLVEHIDLGYKMRKEENTYVLDGDWKAFYRLALEDVQKRMSEK